MREGWQRILRRAGALVLVALLCVAPGTAALAEVAPAPASEALLEAARDLDRYEIEAVFDEAFATLECEQRVWYTNRSADALNNLYFHAYANVFKREDTSPAATEELAAQAYPRGFDPGEIAFDSVSVNGLAVAFALEGADEAVLRVPVGLLAPGEEAALELRYTLRIPLCNYRFGRSDREIWNLGNVFPIAAMYEGGEWRTDPYIAIGDPFYSSCANYTVTLELPKRFQIAASGALRECSESGDRARCTFELPAGREFALSFSDQYKVASDVVEGVLVRAFALSADDAKRELRFATRVLGHYSAMLAPYPYPSLCVAETPLGGYGGMEYPGFVMIDTLQFQAGGALEYVVAHELAHQWWYAQVGNDEVRSPWLDEALTEYTAMLYFERERGEEVFEQMLEQRVESANRLTLPSGSTIASGIDRFDSLWEYSMAVYLRGAGMFHGLRLALGEEVFLSALRTYLEKHRYGIATREDLVDAFNQVTGSDWRGYFDDYLDGSM